MYHYDRWEEYDASDPPQMLLKSRCFYDIATNRIVNKDDPEDFLQL